MTPTEKIIQSFIDLNKYLSELSKDETITISMESTPSGREYNFDIDCHTFFTGIKIECTSKKEINLKDR